MAATMAKAQFICIVNLQAARKHTKKPHSYDNKQQGPLPAVAECSGQVLRLQVAHQRLQGRQSSGRAARLAPQHLKQATRVAQLERQTRRNSIVTILYVQQRHSSASDSEFTGPPSLWQTPCRSSICVQLLALHVEQPEERA